MIVSYSTEDLQSWVKVMGSTWGLFNPVLWSRSSIKCNMLIFLHAKFFIHHHHHHVLY